MLIHKLLLLFYLITTLPLIGQRVGYQSGNASANLVMPLSIEAGAGELDFGDIIVAGRGTREVIRPQNGKEFIIKGQANRNISIVFNNVLLNNYQWVSNTGGISSTLTFIPNVQLRNSKTIRSGDNLTLSPEGLIGKITIDVGGAINVNPKQAIGDYEGLFVISVSY